MEDEISESPRDDITIDTEETDEISRMAEDVQQEEGAVIKKNNDEENVVPVVAKKQHALEKELKSKAVVYEIPRNDSQKKYLWGIILVLAIFVGILGGIVWKKNADDETTTSIVAKATPTLQPTQSPTSFVPTTLRGRVENILADYEPLDEPTMAWLLETSTWEPDYAWEDPNYSDYLWLERYAMGLLYASSNGPNWAKNDNWMSDEPVCSWFSLEPNACPGPMTNLVLCKWIGLDWIGSGI